MAQFFTFTPKRKEDGAIDFYTLMDVFDERKEDGTTSPAGHGERKIKFNDMKVLIATEKPFAKKAVDGIKKIITDAGSFMFPLLSAVFRDYHGHFSGF